LKIGRKSKLKTGKSRSIQENNSSNINKLEENKKYPLSEKTPYKGNEIYLNEAEVSQGEK